MSGNNANDVWQTCIITGAGAAWPVPALPPLGLGEGEVWGCDWMVGDGSGGTESLVGSASNGAACVSMVRQQHPDANGATFSINAQLDGGAGECYAEFGMAEANDAAGWQTCLLIPGFCNYVVGDGVGGTEQSMGIEAATAAEDDLSWAVGL